MCPVDSRARFTAEVPPYQGLQVFDANRAMIADLQAKWVPFVRHETYEHSYPHCWRTDTPLIYKAVSSWFVQGDRHQGTDVGAQPGDQLGAGARPGRGFRQMARRGT